LKELVAFSAASISGRLVSRNARNPSGPIARSSSMAFADSALASKASRASDSIERLFDESLVAADELASAATVGETVRTIVKTDVTKECLRILSPGVELNHGKGSRLCKRYRFWVVPIC
jgi:hypothetical protein